MHPGDTWAPVHNLTLVAVSVVPDPGESFSNGLTVWVAPWRPELVSGAALLGGGGVTVGVIVDVTTWLSESLTTYLIGVAVPVNVGSGSKVTTPVVGSTV